MTTYLRRTKRHVGAPPGTPRLRVDEGLTPFRVRYIRYSSESLEKGEIERGEDLPEISDDSILWIDLIGHSDMEELSRIADLYAVPALIVEDAVDIGQRPRLDAAESGVFLSLRSLAIEQDGAIRREQLGLFMKPGLVISFQETDGDSWAPIRARLDYEQAPLRERKADYLWYALADAVVDAYYLVMDRIAEDLEAIEEDIFTSLPTDIPKRLRAVRKESVALRRATWPLREALEGLPKIAERHLAPETDRLFEDVRDHVRQVSEVNEMLREAISANMDTYISLVGMRQNDVMKMLTLVATIFIPLTFIVGIYGMNFDVMPELGVAWAYPMVWLVMISTAVSLLFHFRRRGWL